jgi:hypothetical protein
MGDWNWKGIAEWTVVTEIMHSPGAFRNAEALRGDAEAAAVKDCRRSYSLAQFATGFPSDEAVSIRLGGGRTAMPIFPFPATENPELFSTITGRPCSRGFVRGKR